MTVRELGKGLFNSLLKVVVVGGLTFLVACGEQPTTVEPVAVEPEPAAVEPAAVEPEPAESETNVVEHQTVIDETEIEIVLPTAPSFKVFFAYDKHAIQKGYLFALNAHLNFMLQQDLETALILEGHTDERGTREYNLALGEKRAVAVKNFLVAKGVDPDRISVISFGEDTPFEVGHNPTAWSLNRRVEFDYD